MYLKKGLERESGMSSEPIKNSLRVPRTARYFLSAPIDDQTKKVWIVLHGYGQHAGYFIRKFEPLYATDTVFVAPEGLSRFYARGSSGRVVASWMTSEDRLDEIADYVHYLDAVVDELQLPVGVELGILGFSQGVATASRWVAKGKVRAQRIILYAGVFPPDLDPGFKSALWKKPKIDVLIGDADEFYKVGDFNFTYESLKKANPHVKIHVFEGGHEIFPGVLRHVME